MPDPTPRQKQILALLWRERCAGRPVPSLWEIAAAVGLRGCSTVYHHLSRMHAAELIEWPPNANRAIRITEAGHLALGRRWRFPVRGTVE